MRIRAPIIADRTVGFSGLIAASAMLGGCGLITSQTEDAAAEQTYAVSTDASDIVTEEKALVAKLEETTAKSGDNCLLAIWAKRKPTDPDFDKMHDFADGGSISCATHATASEFTQTLQALSEAVERPDRDAIMQEVAVPLLFIDADGNRMILQSEEEIANIFDRIFDPDLRAMMRSLDLSDMTVERDVGGFFELGSLWLSVPDGRDRPVIVTINRQALEEVLDARTGDAAAPNG